MNILFDPLFTLLALVIVLPALFLLIETLSAIFLNKTKHLEYKNDSSLRTKILVPAHNEALGIEKTLLNLIEQIKDPQDILVVADNCTDQSAQIAHRVGVSVIERKNTTQRGKGYALDYGLKYLELSKPDVVVFVDADCYLTPGTIERIAQLAHYSGHPVQTNYLMEKSSAPSTKDLISILAFLVKNQVRMLGMSNLGFPCPLQGTGMAIPFEVLQKVSLGSDNLVEDMQLGIDLTLQGHPALYYREASVFSVIPQEANAAKTQRTRWEQGHLNTILTQGPPILKAALEKRSINLLAFALDLSIPPLSLLVLLWFSLTTLSLLTWILGVTTFFPFLILMLGGLFIVSSILLSWAKFARNEIPLSTLLTVPFYIIWKIPIYLSFLLRREQKWVRTERS